ncbi:MAG: AAA family ATPase [Acidobacteria bacterium]|nr:AAA family ATPase [Acidobacteriota bacterium]
MPFREITGHRRLLELLARAARRGSLSPSLIFAGPDGVGKRVAAIALAQVMNCQTPVPLGEDPLGEDPLGEDKDACGTCASCRRIARGVHADVLLIEPGETGAIKVDQIREAIERTAYRPFEGRRRVVIIDDADAVLGEAQNALLKTLEEPPGSSSIVLITSRPDFVLLSRADERYLANADLKPLLQGLLRSFDGARALRAFSAVDQALSALERNASPKIVADWVAFQI